MDKKNTMLLTVIAVATLLVAVVGATFAFFAIQATSESNAKATITGSTENANVGSVVLTGSSTLKLNLTAENMSKANQGKTYYASSDGTAKESEEKITVGTATLTGGDSGIVYECTAKYKVTYDDSSANIQWADADETNGDDKAVVTLYGEDENVTLSGDIQTAIKLKDLQEAAETGKTGTVTFKLTGNGSTVSKTLKASLSLANSEKEQQDRLANKSFTVTLETTEFGCDTVKE